MSPNIIGSRRAGRGGTLESYLVTMPIGDVCLNRSAPPEGGPGAPPFKHGRQTMGSGCRGPACFDPRYLNANTTHGGPNKKGSSRITGERGADFEEEVFLVAVPV
ncbi:hypothetical protein, partial [Burkholderia territorii]|uniref:hypothetical protein n=1 Tax=Burkholderia territorii TaxID=1503055 RepID=UPI001E31FA0F